MAVSVQIRRWRRRNGGRLSAFPDPQFCAPEKVLALNLSKVFPSRRSCWRRRGVTRAGAGTGVRAVAAAAAAAAGAVTAGGGRRLAPRTVPTAARGIRRPTPAPRTQVDLLRAVPTVREGPANSPAAKLVNLGGHRVGPQRECRSASGPTSVPGSKSGSCSEPSRGIWGPGDSTSGRHAPSSAGKGVQTWGEGCDPAVRECEAAAKWSGRGGEELGGWADGGNRVPEAGRRERPGPPRRSPRGLSRRLLGEGRPLPTRRGGPGRPNRRKLKPRVFLHLRIGQE